MKGGAELRGARGGEGRRAFAKRLDGGAALAGAQGLEELR
jgi:hypothetical protein